VLRKLIFLLLLNCLVALTAFSQQQRFSVSGKVTDTENDQPMPMVAVGIEELNLWTVTSLEGNFVLKNVPAGKHVVLARCLGYNTKKTEVDVTEETTLDIGLTPTSLALGEVEVVARRGSGIATSSVIGRSAIEHLQASDVTELMQLLPGQLAMNPDLSGVSQLGIREIVGAAGPSTQRPMASLGTGLVVDGAPASNIANMQMLSTATGTGSFQSTAMQGVDMRQFSVDNIESIEVVQGIPGVEEGDVLTGVVRINTIRGSTPLTTRVKADPNIKQASIGKGFNLTGFVGGTLNINADFLQNHTDIRTPYRSYNRINGNLSYNNVFFQQSKPLTFSFSTRYSDSRSLSGHDPDHLREESFLSHDRSLNMTMSGRWALNSAVLTNLNLNLSGSIQRQKNQEIRFRSFSGVSTLAVNTEPGEFEALFLNPRYYSDVTIDGRPYYLNASLSGTRTFEIGPTEHTVRAGVDYRLSGNEGQGSIFDRTRPPDPTSSAGIRPRPFYDIPALNRLALYIAEELTLPLGGTEFELHAGVRFNNIQPDGPFSSSEDLTTLDPRFNARYRILRNREQLVSDLGFRLGFGILSMTPTISHLYPDKSYRDFLSFNYYDPPHALAVVNTIVIEDTRNYDLRPAQNKKYEAGLDIKVGRVDVQLTGYYEKQTDGFGLHRNYYPAVFNRYERLTIPNARPEFVPGVGVTYQNPETGETVIVPSHPDTLLRSYSYPDNTEEMTKYGLEFELDFGRVESLYTSFLLSGAYMHQHRRSTKDYFSTVTSVSDQVVGLYPAGHGGRINQRFVSNLRTVTQIQPLAMVVSLNLQAIWVERVQNTHEDADGNPIVYTLEPTDDVYGDVSQRKYYHPIAVMDLSGNIKPWRPEYADIRPYADLVRFHSNNYHFVPMRYKPAFQVNMRLTKELSRAATISFNVNNVTYYRPLQRIGGRVDNYTRRNQSLYFSGELTIRI